MNSLGCKRRELIIVLIFSLLSGLIFINKAYHVDEPIFLAVARQILRDPRHPLSFQFNWFYRTQPAGVLFTHSTILPYCLALPLKLAGEREWLMRLFFLPLDLCSAALLYLLAARFLAAPLFPTLLVLASPGYLINIQLLMAEKWAMALGVFSLYALVRGSDSGRLGWYAASAAAAGLAITIKYNAVFFVLAACLWMWSRREPLRRVGGYALAAAALPLIDFLWLEPGRLQGLRDVSRTHRLIFLQQDFFWAHHMRSILAFMGGSVVVAAAWPAYLCVKQGKAGRLKIIGCLAVCALLFAPFLDSPRWPVHHSMDRLEGVLWAWGALLAVVELLSAEPERDSGAGLWISWMACVLLLQLDPFWFVSTRYLMFLIPPLVFGLAGRLEAGLPAAKRRRLYAASLAVVVPLSACLGWVDAHYADAQRKMAEAIRSRYAARGNSVWFTGHWGFQHYMEGIGAEALDELRGGWEEPRAGDIVAVPAVNYGIGPPPPPADRPSFVVRVEEPVPLRLMRYSGVQAGFYSDTWGFLPYAVSREPLEEFYVWER